MLAAISGVLSAAVWEYEEKPASFSYNWEISNSDLTQFVKTGHMPEDGISGSFYYKGRYYPIYTQLLKNTADELSYQIRNKEEIILNAPGIHEDHEKIDPQAVDKVDISSMHDFVRFQSVPGIGTLLEIMPLLPTEDGRIRCLNKADISILPTSGEPLRFSDLKKEKTGFLKTSALKTDLPNEFLALYIQKPGIYQISGQDLADRGIDLRHVRPDHFKLFWWGEEIPCRVTSTYELGIETFQYHDVIQFYIPELKNPYGDYVYNPFSDYDVVHLNWIPNRDGMRFVQENSEITGNAIFLPQENSKFRSTVHLEENQRYEPLARLHEDELSHKYEHRFFSPPISVGRSVSFPFELRNPVKDSPYNVEITLRMQGLTYSVDDEMDHQIYVTVNNRYVLEDEWDGQVPRVSSNADMFYNHEYLIHGENKIDISVKGFEDKPYLDDKVLFDWLKVTYDRYMIAHNNTLRFSPQHGPGKYLFRVEGLTSASDVLIIKNSTNWIRGYQVVPEDTVRGTVTYSIYFEDECLGDEEYMVAGPGTTGDPLFGIVAIDSMRYVNRSIDENYNTSEQGDYIIVTHKDFYEKAKDLVEHKREMGFTPVIYELERIYDEYNFSNESPYAIKAFLTDAYKNWHIMPRYVLFIGDTGTKNSLPIMRYQSTGAIGAIITENWFVDIDDNFVMDMALGRLPVSTEEELDSVITKIKAFDIFGSPSQKMNRMALLTGPESIFRTQMQNYVNTVSPDHIQTDRLYLYDAGRTGDFDAGVYATDSLVNMLNDGVFCLNYIGHGGGYTWDNYVLPYTAFERFKPLNPFIVNSMTCFTNTFSNDNALGEMFIRHPRGAVSVLSTTGYGWVNSNYYFYEKVMQRMFRDKMSHGQAFRYAMTDYFFSTFGRNANFIDQVDGQTVYKYFRRSMFYQMCILGDPSAGFPATQITESTDLSPKSIVAGQTLTVRPGESNIRNGVADIVGTRGQSRKFPVKQKIPLIFSGNEADLIMPEINEGMSDGMVQLSYWDESGNFYVSAAHIAFDAPHIAYLAYYPAQPAIADTGVTIRMNIESNKTIQQAYLRVYTSMNLGASYRNLALNKAEENMYETTHKLYYTGANSFYTAESDTSEALSYYSGNYFMPVFVIDDNTLTGDYYRLSPIVPSSRDIAIIEYGIERGKSKVVLFNQADTSVHVAISMTTTDPDLGYHYYDTLLTKYDVDGKYESGTDKINTFYLDFLPAFGSGTVHVQIAPIEIVDSDTSNNNLQKTIENKWLLSQGGELINTPGDTALLPGTNFEYITPGEQDMSRQAIYINTYNRSYTLSQFGATQALQEVLYINSEKESIDFIAAAGQSLLSNDKLICFLSADMKRFYTLPVNTVDTMVYFPVRENGYYLLAYSDETNPPDIEVNLNARQILIRGYVSERSNFSVIIRDENGVNPQPEFWDILLDGEKIPGENITRVRGEDIREMAINFKLNMDAGEHTLQVIAHDLVGNRAETELFEIIYTGESQLINYGNFPNPFITRTTFIYELTEQFDDMVIKIFTISGQKIFTMSLQENAITDLPLHSIGYHEVPWYGKDEFGNTVANGVYFYVIEGTVDGKKIKSRGKIAKLR